MKTTCYKCGHLYDPNRPNPHYGLSNRCPNCSWGGGTALPESEDRYLVLLSLIYRAKDNGTTNNGALFRIPSTPREMAVLQHGDQCVLDGVHWRITAKNTEKEVFFLSGTRYLKAKDGKLIELAPDDPAEEMMDEINQWKTAWHGQYFLAELKADGELESFLKKSESEKRKIRKRHQRI